MSQCNYDYDYDNYYDDYPTSEDIEQMIINFCKLMTMICSSNEDGSGSQSHNRSKQKYRLRRNKWNRMNRKIQPSML
jgi:hypothetical protein